MPKSAHDKELARAAARREEAKRAERRRRGQIRTGIVLALVAVLVVVAAVVFGGGTETQEASGACDFSPPPSSAPKEQRKDAPKMSLDKGMAYQATLETSCGSITIDLLSDRAPVAVNNFVTLSEDGWYDGTLFHRISNDIDIVQGGDAMCVANKALCGQGGPGYAFDDEITGKESYDPGTVAMANSGPDTNGSQFFIVTGPQGRNLSANYTIFGRLADPESLKVAQAIQGLPVTTALGAPDGSPTETPQDTVWLRSVKISQTEGAPQS